MATEEPEAKAKEPKEARSYLEMPEMPTFEDKRWRNFVLIIGTMAVIWVVGQLS